MKLLKPEGCLLSSGGGNEKEQTMIVEGQGIGFRTRVRLPSGPLKKALILGPRFYSCHILWHKRLGFRGLFLPKVRSVI